MEIRKTNRIVSGANDRARRLTTVLLVVYLIVLCWILLLKLGVHFSYMDKRQVNLIPFHEVFSASVQMDASQIIMNAAIFVPLGLYVGALMSSSGFLKKLMLIFLVSGSIELLQYSLAIGAFDATDIATNTTGGIIGLVIFKALERAFKKEGKAQKLLNMIGVVGTVLMVLLLALLKLNMLPIRYS